MHLANWWWYSYRGKKAEVIGTTSNLQTWTIVLQTNCLVNFVTWCWGHLWWVVHTVRNYPETIPRGHIFSQPQTLDFQEWFHIQNGIGCRGTCQQDYVGVRLLPFHWHSNWCKYSFVVKLTGKNMALRTPWLHSQQSTTEQCRFWLECISLQASCPVYFMGNGKHTIKNAELNDPWHCTSSKTKSLWVIADLNSEE